MPEAAPVMAATLPVKILSHDQSFLVEISTAAVAEARERRASESTMTAMARTPPVIM
jgi:hypothetical protein